MSSTCMIVMPTPSSISTTFSLTYTCTSAPIVGVVSKFWSLDRRAALSLARAVDQCVKHVPVLSSQRTIGLSVDSREAEDEVIHFHLETFLFRITDADVAMMSRQAQNQQSSSSELYRLDIDLLLAYVGQKTFSWTVMCETFEKYEMLQDHSGTNAEFANQLSDAPFCPSSFQLPSPVRQTRTAESLLGENMISESQWNAPEGASQHRNALDLATPGHMRQFEGWLEATTMQTAPDCLPSNPGPPMPDEDDVTPIVNPILGMAVERQQQNSIDWEALDTMGLEEAMQHLPSDPNDVGRCTTPSTIGIGVFGDLVPPPYEARHTFHPPRAQNPRNNSAAPSAFIPPSSFALADKAKEEDLTAARFILTTIKSLAFADQPLGMPHRRSSFIYSIEYERDAILSMYVNSTLNIGSSRFDQLEEGEILRRAFERYDCHGTLTSRRRSQESAEKALLLLAVRLLRHTYLYRSAHDEANSPGKRYARDFDKLIPVSSRSRGSSKTLIQRSKVLCRLVVACGHPCIVLVLVRLAVRSSLNLGMLLDRLPVQQFCRWIASGKVTQTRLRTASIRQGEQLESDLLWAHEMILLPLLAVSAQRIPEQLLFLDGRVECSVEACLASIVPHANQATYARFLRGEWRNDHWQDGRVALQGSDEGLSRHANETARVSSWYSQRISDDIEEDDDDEDEANQSDGDANSSMEMHYSTPKNERLFQHTNVAAYINSLGTFDTPPAFLLNAALHLTDDGYEVHRGF